MAEKHQFLILMSLTDSKENTHICNSGIFMATADSCRVIACDYNIKEVQTRDNCVGIVQRDEIMV